MPYPVFMTDLPGADALAIIPSDVAAGNQGPFRRLYVGVSGDVSIVTLGGTAVTFKAVPVGVIDVGLVRVNSTATTATNMVGIY